MELLAKDGRVIVSTTSPSGTLTTSAIDGSDLPLRAKGYAEDEIREQPVEGLANIDNPTWIHNVSSTVEAPVPNSYELVFAYPEQILLQDGTLVEYPVYKVYQTYRGFYWRAGDVGTIPAFSQRAKIDRIRNVSGETLEFSSYVSGVITLSDNAEGGVDPNWPGQVAWFRGDYLQPVKRHIAWQYGDQKKPPDEWFYIDRFYEDAVGNVSLHAFCDVL